MASMSFIPAFLTIYVAVMYSLQTKAFLSVATPYAIPHPVKRNREQPGKTVGRLSYGVSSETCQICWLNPGCPFPRKLAQACSPRVGRNGEISALSTVPMHSNLIPRASVALFFLTKRGWQKILEK
jgi:hypothetical protein